MEQYKGGEKRKSVRIPVDFTVVYQVDKPMVVRLMVGTDRDIEATMMDLSDSGLAMMTNYNIPSCSVLSMKFILINMHLPTSQRIRKMHISGLVRYNITTPKGEHRLGIFFTRISNEDKKAITDFINMSSYRRP